MYGGMIGKARIIGFTIFFIFYFSYLFNWGRIQWTDLLPFFKLIRESFQGVEVFRFSFEAISCNKTIIDYIKFWFVCEPIETLNALNHYGSASSVEERSDQFPLNRPSVYEGSRSQRSRAKHLEQQADDDAIRTSGVEEALF